MNYIIGQQLVFVLGLINIVSLFLLLLSCRCMIRFKLFQKLSKYKAIKDLYKWHCFFWIIFALSILGHTILASTVYGFPF